MEVMSNRLQCSVVLHALQWRKGELFSWRLLIQVLNKPMERIRVSLIRWEISNTRLRCLPRQITCVMERSSVRSDLWWVCLRLNKFLARLTWLCCQTLWACVPIERHMHRRPLSFKRIRRFSIGRGSMQFDSMRISLELGKQSQVLMFMRRSIVWLMKDFPWLGDILIS